ncbi:MAG TPA: thiamine phosphate synthase [Novosphingobium sp.]
MRRQSPSRDALPDLWLVSDARNDAALERALARLPRGSGLIVRHYHLAPDARRERFDALARLARRRGHRVVLAGSAEQARRWDADGFYGAPSHGRGLHLATAHSLRELRRARHADAVLLSPVFATRSHPGARTLGPLRFRLLAARSPVPVIALGGMTKRGAKRLAHPKWAAIDGLCDERTRRNPKDS